MSQDRPLSTQQQILASVTRLETVVIGVPETDDRGMAGAIKEIKEHLSELNGQVRTNTIFRRIGTWVSCAIFLALLGIVVRLTMG